jgi:hypothetical protein
MNESNRPSFGMYYSILKIAYKYERKINSNLAGDYLSM